MRTMSGNVATRAPRAALYVRVSTRAQADKHGTAYQRQALEEMATARGWTVAGVWADEGVSGRTTARPQLDEMLLRVRRREVDVVAVWRFDRYARSLSHLVTSLVEFDALGVQFVSHQEGMDTSTPLGRALFAIAGAMAELEANLARERVQAGVDAARARGARLGRPRRLPALTAAAARALVELHGGLRAAARQLGVGAATLQRALRS
jgi:DNA invertase Pin-like site-specific DNA recombinase